MTPLRAYGTKASRPWFASLAIAAAAAGAYASSFSGAFQFDDIPSILENPTIRHLWPLSGPLSPPSGALTVSSRPLLNLSFALNYAVSAYGIWSYHALNLVIHIGVALSLFGVLRRTLGGVGVAAAAAAIWAVHPLTTEAVTYVVQRAESLASLFYVLTLYGAIRYATGSPPRKRWAVLAVLCCWLGVATKEIVATVPVAVLLYDRVFIRRNWSGIWKARGGFYLWLASSWIPLLWLVAQSGWNRGATAGFNAAASSWQYWLSQGEAMARYARVTLWPWPLCFEYGPPGAPVALALALFILVVAASVAFAWGVVKGRPWGFAGCAVMLLLAPTSVVPGILQFMAEHRMYLALAVPVSVIVAAVKSTVDAHFERKRRTTAYALLVVGAVLGLGVCTCRRNQTYRSDLALWSDTVRARPQSALAQANLGHALLIRGRIEEGRIHTLRSVVLDPTKPLPHFNLGLADEETGRLEDALREYHIAWHINPLLYSAQIRAGELLNRMGRPREAETLFRQALATMPDFAEGHAGLGFSLAAEGRVAEAVAEFEESLRLEPAQAQIEYNLGLALARENLIDAAAAHYAAAVKLQADFGSAELNLGIALGELGRLDDARAALRAAVRIMPDSPEAHEAVATALDLAGQNLAAVAEFRRTLVLRPNYPQAHYNLGNALLHCHDLAGARAEFAEALRQKPDFAAAAEMLDRINAVFTAPSAVSANQP